MTGDTSIRVAMVMDSFFDLLGSTGGRDIQLAYGSLVKLSVLGAIYDVRSILIVAVYLYESTVSVGTTLGSSGLPGVD